MLGSATLDKAPAWSSQHPPTNGAIRRQVNIARAALRSAAFMPYFKFTSGMVLAEALSVPAVILIGLSYAVLCHGIRDCLVSHEGTQREILVPFKGACILFILLSISVPIIAYVFSRSSFGPSAETPSELLPAFALLVAPCCLCFGVAQRQRRFHARLLSRLGLTTVS